MRGVVLGIMPDGSYGQVAADDGQRYSFWTSEIRNGPVQVGQTVEFKMWEGQPVEIYGLPQMPPPNMPKRPVQAQQQRPQASSRPSGYSTAPASGFGAAASAGFAGATASMPAGSAYWIQLFTSPSGRISRRQFWLHGVLPIIAASIVLGWIPIIGQILMLGFLWGGICIAFKRFHDVGYPGWYSLLYLVPMVAAGILLGLGLFMISIIDLMWLLAEILWGIGFLIGLAQLIFVYVRVGQEGSNQYGPDPLAG
jgi:uncharacterized membrane protein YhaH (DUF805 family)